MQLQHPPQNRERRPRTARRPAGAAGAARRRSPARPGGPDPGRAAEGPAGLHRSPLDRGLPPGRADADAQHPVRRRPGLGGRRGRRGGRSGRAGHRSTRGGLSPGPHRPRGAGWQGGGRVGRRARPGRRGRLPLRHAQGARRSTRGRCSSSAPSRRRVRSATRCWSCSAPRWSRCGSGPTWTARPWSATGSGRPAWPPRCAPACRGCRPWAAASRPSLVLLVDIPGMTAAALAGSARTPPPAPSSSPPTTGCPGTRCCWAGTTGPVWSPTATGDEGARAYLREPRRHRGRLHRAGRPGRLGHPAAYRGGPRYRRRRDRHHQRPAAGRRRARGRRGPPGRRGHRSASPASSATTTAGAGSPSWSTSATPPRRRWSRRSPPSSPPGPRCTRVAVSHRVGLLAHRRRGAGLRGVHQPPRPGVRRLRRAGRRDQGPAADLEAPGLQRRGRGMGGLPLG